MLLSDNFVFSVNPESSEPFKVNDDYVFFLVASFFVAYYSVASFFNKTYIFADKAKIEIRHRPVPWPGDLKLDTTDISQCYVKYINGYWDEGSLSTPGTYALRAKTKAGKNINMVSELDMSENELALVKDKLETFLHIDN